MVASNNYYFCHCTCTGSLKAVLEWLGTTFFHHPHLTPPLTRTPRTAIKHFCSKVKLACLPCYLVMCSRPIKCQKLQNAEKTSLTWKNFPPLNAIYQGGVPLVLNFHTKLWLAINHAAGVKLSKTDGLNTYLVTRILTCIQEFKVLLMSEKM